MPHVSHAAYAKYYLMRYFVSLEVSYRLSPLTPPAELHELYWRRHFVSAD